MWYTVRGLTWRKKGTKNFGQVEPVDVRSMIGPVFRSSQPLSVYARWTESVCSSQLVTTQIIAVFTGSYWSTRSLSKNGCAEGRNLPCRHLVSHAKTRNTPSYSVRVDVQSSITCLARCHIWWFNLCSLDLNCHPVCSSLVERSFKVKSSQTRRVDNKKSSIFGW